MNNREFPLDILNTNAHSTKADDTKITEDVVSEDTTAITENTEHSESSSLLNVSDIKSLIYSEYSPIKINYSDGDTTGYFKADGEYYSFTLESSNIVIRDSSEKIVNVIIISTKNS